MGEKIKNSEETNLIQEGILKVVPSEEVKSKKSRPSSPILSFIIGVILLFLLIISASLSVGVPFGIPGFILILILFNYYIKTIKEHWPYFIFGILFGIIIGVIYLYIDNVQTNKHNILADEKRPHAQEEYNRIKNISLNPIKITKLVPGEYLGTDQGFRIWLAEYHPYGSYDPKELIGKSVELIVPDANDPLNFPVYWGVDNKGAWSDFWYCRCGIKYNGKIVVLN